jgi:catechol 2,3-dioxygenase-like lactoylglutathione lyase family enzyme
MAVVGAHILIHSPEVEGLRAFFRDVLGLGYVEDNGWPIYTLPPAELAVHPSEGSTEHQVSLMCDDIAATVSELRAKGVGFEGEPVDYGHGPMVMMNLPGGVQMLLYEPHHPTAI